MGMPWTCDALLPQAERYASLKFRRFARRFDPTRLDYPDAVELCAVVRTLPHVDLFKWKAAGRREFARLDDHMRLVGDADVSQAVAENRAAYTRTEGLRVLQIMQEHGPVYGKVPEIVRFALLDLRKAGFSQPKIAELTSLTHDQVRVMANGPRRVRATVRLADAALVAR